MQPRRGLVADEEAKLHILHGEFLEGMGPSRADDARHAFCRAYRADATAADGHVQTFFSQGVSALYGDGGPNLELAENYLAMAACIDATHEEARDALAVVREAIALRDGKGQQ